MYITIIFTLIGQLGLEVFFKFIHPEVLLFLEKRRRIVTKSGYIFQYAKGDLLLSTKDHTIGILKGFSNGSFKTKLEFEYKDLINIAKRDIFTAMSELVYVIRMLKHGPGLENLLPRIIMKKGNKLKGKGFTSEELETYISSGTNLQNDSFTIPLGSEEFCQNYRDKPIIYSLR